MGSSEDDASGESSGNFFERQSKSRNRYIEWVLVDGDRLLLTFIGAVVVYALLLALFVGDAIAFANDDSVTRMASGMIAGTFSLVTLVVSVNQLILSQELSPAGQFRDRFEGVMDFRRDIEDAANVPATPAEPTRMLDLIVAVIRDRADDLEAAVADHEDEAYRDLVTRYADSVRENADQVAETLEEAEVSAYDALSAAVRYDDGLQHYAARHLRNDASELSAETSTAFDELIEALRLFSTAQEHFKTIYLQRELTRFSQLTVYFGVPAILAAALIALVYGDFGGLAIDVGYAPFAVSFLATVVFVPLWLLAAYILRTATLARRTAKIGPMIPEKDSEEGPLEVTYGGEESD